MPIIDRMVIGQNVSVMNKNNCIVFKFVLEEGGSNNGVYLALHKNMSDLLVNFALQNTINKKIGLFCFS